MYFLSSINHQFSLPEKDFQLLMSITDIWLFAMYKMTTEKDTHELQEKIDNFLSLFVLQIGARGWPNLDTLRLWPALLRYIGIPEFVHSFYNY